MADDTLKKKSPVVVLHNKQTLALIGFGTYKLQD